MNTNGFCWEVKRGGKHFAYAYSFDAAYNKAYPLNDEGRIADAPRFGAVSISPLFTEQANEYFVDLSTKYMNAKGEHTDYDCLVRLGHWLDRGFIPHIDSYKVIWCEDHIVGNCSVDDFGIYRYPDTVHENTNDLEQYGLEMNREE